MPNWSFVLADKNGSNLAELATGTGRTLTFQRNGIPEVTLSISHEDAAATDLFAALANGIPHLKAYRDSVLRFNGYLAPFDEQLEEDCKLNLVFRGPFSRLLGDGQYPGRFTTTAKSYTATDAGQLAKNLIDLYGSDVGIDTTGTIDATVSRDRVYQYANVGEAIIALTKVINGFDFEILPVDSGSTIGQLRVYGSQGNVQSNALFQYGPTTLANVRSVSRQTLPPRNLIRVIGANRLIGSAADAASIDRYGTWFVQEQQTDISEQQTLTDRATSLLRPKPLRVVGFTPEPAKAPQPWDDYWLGDTVQFYGLRGAFMENVQMRVNKITIVVDDEGNETAAIEDPSGDGQIQASVEGETVE